MLFGSCVARWAFNEGIDISSAVCPEPEGKHILALSQNREVYSWGIGENGQLGLGDIKWVMETDYTSF